MPDVGTRSRDLAPRRKDAKVRGKDSSVAATVRLGSVRGQAGELAPGLSVYPDHESQSPSAPRPMATELHDPGWPIAPRAAQKRISGLSPAGQSPLPKNPFFLPWRLGLSFLSLSDAR